MTFLRNHWYDLGGLIAMGILGGLALFGADLSAVRPLLLLNFVALLVHQFEEYRLPGFFPGFFNGGLYRSETPDRYPLNTRSALVVNVALGWSTYLLPILLPGFTWLGLAAVMVGFAQVVAHGVVFPLRAHRAYCPGIISALLLHVPVGLAYILAARPTGGDWLIGLVLLPLFAVGAVLAPIAVFRDRDTPYRFAERQVGPYARTGRLK